MSLFDMSLESNFLNQEPAHKIEDGSGGGEGEAGLPATCFVLSELQQALW